MTDAANSISLTMLTWNIEGMKHHVHYLRENLLDDCIDVAFLSEPQIYQHELQTIMRSFENSYSFSLNSDDLYDLELPMKISHAKGGTMFLWKKWLDPYVTIPECTKSSSFHVLVLNHPSCTVSIHVSVYLPTSGKDFEYTSQLTDLRACIEELLESYPSSVVYLRGDFNTNKKNTSRCSQLENFTKALNIIQIKIPHKTYHHFVGEGFYDSEIDLILHSSSVPCESVKKIWCKYNEPEISSHHDIIVSLCKLPPITPILDCSPNLDSAPRIDLDRKKIKWTEEGVSTYLTLFSRLSNDVCNLWYHPSSVSLSTLFLRISKSLCDMAAEKSNKIMPTKHQHSLPRVPVAIKQAKNRLRRTHSLLLNARRNPCSSPYYLHLTEQRFHAAKKTYRKIVRQDRASRSVDRDLCLNNFTDVYKYVRSLKNKSSVKLRELKVGDNVYKDDMVPDGFFHAMGAVKYCDRDEILKNPYLSSAVQDSEHIVELCKAGNKLPPVSIETSRSLLTRLKKEVADVYGISSLHYLHAGDEGNRQFALLLNTILLNPENATIKELNTTHGLIIYKGGQKDKTSERSYRTISTCPIVAKALDLYLRDLYQEKWDRVTAPTQYQKKGSSHELASLLLTEIIQFSLYYLKKPLFLLVLDAQAAFDRCLKEVLCTKFYALGMNDNSVNLVMNRLENRSTIYNWDGVTMGPSKDHSGFEQGGINSGDYYKLYNNEQLQIAQDSELGVDIKSCVVSGIGQADDVILPSNDIRNLSLLAHLTEHYCDHHRVTLVPSKTKLLPIYSKKQEDSIEYAKVINPVKIADKVVNFVDQAEHVGVLRCKTGSNLPHIYKRITAHKKAMAAVYATGIARNHRGSPSSALKIQKIYGTSVLLSGVASLVLSHKELILLENHFKSTLERIQKLYANTPKDVVYMMAGSLPVEGVIHCRQLSLFSMICRLKSDLLHKHAMYVLTTLDNTCKSWFFVILEICALYRLPHPLTLLNMDLKKESFKSLVKQNVRRYWTEKMIDETNVRNLKSLRYFQPSSCTSGRPHLIWEFSKNHPFESSKAIVIARIMSGRYRTDMLSRHWTRNRHGFCLASSSCQVPGDLEHMFVTCPAIEPVKSRILSFWSEKTMMCPPLHSFLDRTLSFSPQDFLQFIVNPTIFPEVQQLCHLYGLNLLGLILHITRTYAFHIDRCNRKIRGIHVDLS